MILALILLSCADIFSIPKGFKEIELLFFEVKDEKNRRLSADVLLLSEGTILRPEHSENGLYFFDAPSGLYQLVCSKEGYNRYISEVEILNGRKLLFKGEREIVLERSNRVASIESKVRLNPSIIELLEEGRIELSVDSALAEKSKHRMLSERFEIEDGCLKLFWKLIVERENVELDLNFHLGKFNFSRKLYFADDGELIEGVEYSIGEEYSITELILPLSASDLGFKIQSEGYSFFEADGNKITVHLLGESAENRIIFDSFESLSFTTRTFQSIECPLVGKRLNARVVDHSPQKRLELELEDKLKREVYLVRKCGESYNIFNRIDQSCDIFSYPDFGPLAGTLSCLVIERDDDRIRRQRLCSLDRAMPEPIDYNFELSERYCGKRALDGTIFLNLNDARANTIMQEVANLRRGVQNLVFKFYLISEETMEPLPGLNVDLKLKDGKHLLNLNENFSLHQHGDKLAIELFRSKRSLSKIGKPLRIGMRVYGVVHNDPVSLSSKVPITDDGRVVPRERINFYEHFYDYLFFKEFSVEPLFSSQTFLMKMSYSNENRLLDSQFYDNYLRNSDGEIDLVISNKRALNGRLGQNFHQLVILEKDESQHQNEMSSLSLASMVGILTGNIFQQALSLGGLIFGSYGYISSKMRIKRNDLHNWDVNFLDSKGKRINGIESSGQKNYAVEWKMYVCTKGMDEVLFDRAEITKCGAKIMIRRTLLDLDGREIIEVSDSNFAGQSTCRSAKLHNSWYLFKLRVDKVGPVDSRWGINVPIPFKIFRHTAEELEAVEKTFI